MLDISQIFQNTSGDLNEDDIQRMIDSLGIDETLDDGILSFLMGGEIPSFVAGGPYDPATDPENMDNTYMQMGVDPQINSLNFYGPYDPQKTPVGYRPGMVLPTEEELQPIQRVASGPMMDGKQVSYDQFMDDPRNSSSSAPTSGSGNYDNMTFKEAWNSARSVLGPKGTFKWKGKEYTTKSAEDIKQNNTSNRQQSNTSNSNSSKNNSPENPRFMNPGTEELNARKATNNAQTIKEQKNLINELKADFNGTPKINNKTLERSKTEKKAIVDPANGMIYENGRAYTIGAYQKNYNSRVRAYNRDNGVGYQTTGRPDAVTGSSVDRQENILNEYNKGVKEFMLKKSFIDKSKNQIVVNGARFANTPEGKQKARKYLESKTGDKFDTGSDNSREFNRRLVSREDGGDIPMFFNGGLNLDTTSPTILVNGQTVPNPNYIDPNLRPQLLASTSPTTPVLGVTGVEQRGNDFSGTSVLDQNRWYSDSGNKRFVEKGSRVTEEFNTLLNSDDANKLTQEALTEEEKKKQELEKLKETLLGTLNSDTSMSIEDGLYKAGEAFAFNPSDDVYTNNEGEVNKTAKGFGQGFNILKGVAAGGKVLLGGTRNFMEGFGYQKKNDLIENERKRREILARKNANTMNAEFGGEIPFFNDGGYLEFLEDGTNDMYSQMGPQDPREQMPLPQEMTGEYIQQQPQEAGIQPNAEIETDEYVQHPDGGVQQVEGREHKEGGERVALEPGARVVSDNLKLGAKNAKILSQDYGIKVKANDTFATAISRYTKKIGLEELNSQQEEYFNKLKKDSKTKSEETSELNSQYLSEKINGIEQKKGLLEQLRSSFTDHVYNLQETTKTSDSSKKKDLPSPEDIVQAIEMANDQPSMENGGMIRSFAGGGEIRSYLEKAMTTMGYDLSTEENKKIYETLLANVLNTNKTIDAGKIYAELRISAPRKLPKTYSEFKNSRWKDEELGGEDVFGMIEEYTGPKSATTKTDNRSASNTSKTKADAETVVGERGTTGSDYVSLANNPIYSRTKNSQGFTESGVGINTSGKVNKDNEGQVYKYLYDNFPGARKFFTTEKDFAGREVNPKLKDVKGLQTYYNSTLLPSLKKWGEDNISNAKELDNYYNALDQFSYDGKGTRQLDGIFGDFTGDKNPLRWKFVTPAEKKQLDDLGVSQVSDLYDESGKLKDKFNFLSSESQERLSKTRNYNGIDMYIDEIPEAPKNDQSPIEEYQKPLEKGYTRPILPDMSLEPPRPMDAHAKNQRRFVLNDAIEMSPENQINEMYRQADATADQFTGLTDTQRAAALSNLGANTQQNVAQTISGVEAANVQNRNQVNQANNAIINNEENARVADAQRYEELQMTAKAKTQQDYDDFMDKNREIRIKRFNYLTKDRQINDMAENFKTDANGNIEFDPATGLPLRLPGASSGPQMETVVERTTNPDGTITTKTVQRPVGTRTKTR